MPLGEADVSNNGKIRGPQLAFPKQTTTVSANIGHYGNKCEVGSMKQWKQGIIRRDVQSRINMERELNDGKKRRQRLAVCRTVSSKRCC